MTYQDNLTRYDMLVDKCPEFKRKGKTMPYTSANGYMFSLLNKAGELGFRFSKDVQKHYQDKFTTTLFMSYNSIMKGYILITEDMLKDEELIVALLKESFNYVMSLEPK